ncbi:BTAD domain-containing putative transcriptional regulator, partial [Streptomyces clavuligerus]|uniref:BTAD domain-containing putative transcriptional regulator n=1 Tax=Streptomyces clavuligerus TaxID=1901 RepID=UPI0018D07CC3
PLPVVIERSPPMRFRVLGPVSMSPRTPSAAKPRALLATLLVRAGEVVPAHSLIDELWGTEPPRTATTTLQVYVSQLRKILAEDEHGADRPPEGAEPAGGLLLTRAPGYLLQIPDQENAFDLPCFERLRNDGRAAHQERDFARASRLLHEALALWSGPALSGIPHGVRLESAAIRLDELRMEVLEQRIVADLRLGHHQELAGELLALANEHPLRETLHGHLMVALYRTGRGSDALRVYGRLRHSLVEELGVEPGPGLARLHERVLRRDPALTSTQWGLVVADEAQHIKNPASATAKALREIPARARLAVTGTPVENNLTDLWAILDWTNPGLFGTRTAFRARYGAVEKDPDAPAAAGLTRLIAPFMLRRRKTDPGIAPELPGKVHHHRIVALTDEQTGLYEANVRDTLREITASSGIERRGLVLKLLQALRQICNTPTLYLKEPLEDAEPATLARRSGKLAALDDLMSTLAARSEAALVFTGYVQMGRILEHHLRARGRSVRFLHGGTPPARRQELVDIFQHDPDPAPVLILSVKAAGTGLTLTRAEHVIHYDRPWNPAVEDQATDRAHRIGQNRTVQVHHLITEGTVEDHISELLARKRALTDAVLTSGEGALTELDDTEIAALVTLGTR